ncbi:RNA polymerase sigma factor [Paraliomyxa miuraensis]|uniref:RNA polymerase sigma factor n=1 Tax=Paraliomyxa miuraensis TaxID=376150 RepID=UPI00225BA9D6|nr:RNA polymerase sigma factor [Paraliomyxa miuraensis]MCX4240421.1 RNA polymerase sigma factor [Paraliomyxa miuraensis]
MTWDPSTSDAELLQAWRRGDKTAADALITRHGPRLYNFFASKVGRSADDLCQQTLQECVEAHERIEENGGRHSFRSFLFAVARRRLLDHYRGSELEGQRIDPLEHSVADLEPGVSEAIAAREQQRRLGLALRRLPVDFQIALELLHWEGLTVAEISRVVEAPEGTLEARLSRARKKLETLLHAEPSLAEATVEGLLTEDDRGPE